MPISELKAEDSRKISSSALNERRVQYVRFRLLGMSNNQASALVGFRVATGSVVWKRFRDGGVEGLRLKKRGRPMGSKRALSPAQEEEIYRIMSAHTPDEVGLPYSLWSREAAKLLILEKFGIDLALRTMTLYFSRWKLTYQKPAKRAYQQNDQKVLQWLQEEYPQIKEEAVEEKAEIFWCDETGIRNSSDSQRGFSPEGQTPVLKVETRKARVNMISALTNQGKLRFMLYVETMTTVLLIMFLQRLIREAGRKIYVILDNLRVHHSKKLNEWQQKNSDKIKIYYLPAYSPELNPDEYLNGNLKKAIHSGISPRTETDIKKKVRQFMRGQQKTPEKIRKLFRHKKVDYAG